MTENTIAADIRYVRTNDVVATNMDGETVMMDVQKGEYFALSGSGPQIWEKLAEPVRLDEVVAALNDEFETGEAEDLEATVTDFFKRLLDKGLVRPAD